MPLQWEQMLVGVGPPPPSKFAIAQTEIAWNHIVQIPTRPKWSVAQRNPPEPRGAMRSSAPLKSRALGTSELRCDIENDVLGKSHFTSYLHNHAHNCSFITHALSACKRRAGSTHGSAI